MNKIDRELDMESVKYDRDEYKRKMNMAWEQTKEYEKEVHQLRNEVIILTEKVNNAEKIAQTSREIMTSQIVEFNQHKNSYIEEI